MTNAVNIAQGGSNNVTMRNRIINGAMVIDQRNAGASVTASTANLYTLDRFQSVASQSSKYTIQQNAALVTPPAGFINYLGVTSSSAYSVLTGDYFSIQQTVEGLNITDFAWGTASAATVTLSFWVRSSLTGTFGGVVKNNGGTRSYPFSYTVNTANTWEFKTITILGDTTGTWLTTNGAGILLNFGLGAGATFSGTAGAWASANLVQPSGTVSVVGTSGATFYITGVQLEAGTTASPFEQRLYGTELALCQRYAIQDIFNGAGVIRAATTTATITVALPVRMRATPTMTNISNGATDGFSSQGTSGAVGDTLNALAPNILVSTAGSMGTQGYGVSMRSQTILFSAEL